MDDLRWIKTDKQYKKGSIVKITEPMDGRKGDITRKYLVIQSSDILNDDDDGYICTILQEIKGKLQWIKLKKNLNLI